MKEGFQRQPYGYTKMQVAATCLDPRNMPDLNGIPIKARTPPLSPCRIDTKCKHQRCGFGKANDRVEAKEHRPSGIPVGVWWGALTAEGGGGGEEKEEEDEDERRSRSRGGRGVEEEVE